MALPDYSMRQLLEAGVHFGHQAHRWNPKMGDYIFGIRNNIHIIDLAQTVPMLHHALQAVSDTVAKGGRILFVGTKRQAQDAIAEAAKKSRAILRQFALARRHADQLEDDLRIDLAAAQARGDALLERGAGYTKKERLDLQRERDKLDRSLGGIKDMGGLPDMLFVIDTNKEDIAIKEARRLNIPVAAIVDTNCDPNGITFAVPGNDDASRAISLYCDLIARAAIDGISRSQGERGIDIGAAAEPIVEDLPKANDAGYEALPGPRGVADDLKKLPGVSPAIEKQLNDLGIFHYWQIADLTHEQAHRLGEEVGLPGRVDSGSPRPRPSPPKPNNDPGAAARAIRAATVLSRNIVMAEITAALVKDLREQTGAGMMDCKAALTETKGDVEAAVDWLRKKGLSKAAKKAGRVAAEGLIGISTAPQKGAMVEVNAETDFVARNDHFQGLVKLIADVALSHGGDVEKIKAAKVGSQTVEEAIASAIATIGENMSLRRAAVAVGRQGRDRHLYAQFDLGRARQDRRAGRARIDRRRAGTDRASAGWSRCISRPPIRWRSIRRAFRPT